MTGIELDFGVQKLGECRVASPMKGTRFVSDDDHVLYHSDLTQIRKILDAGQEPPCMESGELLSGSRSSFHSSRFFGCS